MMPCRRVAADVWLGFARCERETTPIPPESRWLADRKAADRAVAVVLEASGLGRERCVISRSHTRGMGAAVAAPARVAAGVDLVEVARVRRRHADAILSREEWEALAPWAAVRPALGWALKEAAAKACGDPARCFPIGVRIAAGDGGIRVEELGSGSQGFMTGWGLLDGFLYAWVRGVGAAEPDRGASAHGISLKGSARRSCRTVRQSWLRTRPVLTSPERRQDR